MSFHDLKQQIPQELAPGFLARFVHSQKVTLAYWEIAPGAKLPAHQHPHEQTVNLLEGEFELTWGEHTQVLTPGMVVVIPPEVPHQGRALVACRILDVFAPVREDYKFASAD